MKIIYVRHGQTDWNKNNILQGHTDIPLNMNGLSQAYEVKEKLKQTNIDIVISSPLIRAFETAKVITEGRDLDILTDKRIVERNFGDLEGVDFYSMDYDSYWYYDKNLKFVNGESITDVFERVTEFFNELKTKYTDETILIVAHGGVSIAVECYFNGIPKDNNLMKKHLANCQIAEYNI